ncbi:MAG: FAD-dependent oxidoreductase [Alphaproteobacteria bacterium]|nr:FAD-dependent oxidoreductase [Alphaproteobacteria bacterium]
MQSHARVVVIGGGITGCAVLYHLAKLGWKDVVLVERKELTSGSSWHAAGSLFSLTSPTGAAVLQRYTRELYPVIEQEGDQPVGYHTCGGFSVARSADELKKLKIMRSRCLRNGIPSEFISIEEAKRRAPVVNVAGVIGVLWEPEKGYVDPASATNAFAKAARKFGASIQRHTPVTGTRQLPSGEWEVITPACSIRCEYVVNAAGLWAREVAGQAGIALPLMPVEHHYLVTEDVPEIVAMKGELPNITDAEGNWYMRQEGRGLLLGAYEDRCVHWAENGTPLDFGHELLPDDLARMERNFAHAVEVVPCLKSAGIKRVINGPMIFSPDLGPLLGPYPGKRGYICAAGVMTGFNQGGGIGKVLAEWIIEGEPSVDIFMWDVARFGEWAGKAYTKARTKYFYEKRSARIYPYQQFAAGRPVRTFPAHDRQKAAGAVFGESYGFEIPLWYARPGETPEEVYRYERQNWFEAAGEEARAVRAGVGLLDISGYSKFEVSGPGAASWLDRMMANKLPALGRTVLTPMLSQQGRLIGDFTLSRIAEDRFLILGSGPIQRFHMRWFEQNLPRDGSVRVDNVSPRTSGFHIAGPKSRELLGRLTDADIGGNAFPFLHARSIEIGSCPEAQAIRVSFTGELGYEIYFPIAYQAALFDAITSAGRDLGLRLFGTRALMSLRLEKSFPSWALDLTSDYTPWETTLGRFVRLDKGEFIGRAAAAKTKQAGVRERFATFVIDAAGADATGGEAVFCDGELAGYTTSGGYGFNVGESLALGYVRPQFYRPTGSYEVEIVGELRPARLSETARVDPAGERMRS